MTTLPQISPGEADLVLVKLAREVAIDHATIEALLERYHLTHDEWRTIQNNPRFQALLSTEIEAWQSALNTEERTKMKAAAMVEEFLPEAYGRMHDNGENLPAKVELLKLVARIAGLGMTGVGVEGGGERFSININLGADAQLKFDKEVTSKVIDATPLE
jgi:hypothetical protein